MSPHLSRAACLCWLIVATAANAQQPDPVALLDSVRSALELHTDESLRSAISMARAARSAAARGRNDSLELEALLLLAEAHNQSRGYDSALNTGRHALKLATATHSRHGIMLAYFEIGRVFWKRPNVDSVLFYARAGLPLALAESAMEPAMTFANRISFVYWIRGHPDTAAKWSRFAIDTALAMSDYAAVDLAKSNASEMAARFMSAAADTALAAQRSGAQERLRQVVVARRLGKLSAMLFAVAGDPQQSLSATFISADTYLIQGLPDSALVLARMIQDSAAAKNFRELGSYALEMRIKAFQALGMLDSLRAALGQGAQMGPEAQGAVRISTAAMHAVEQARRGEVDSAVIALESLLPDVQRSNTPELETVVRVALGTVYGNAGRLQAAATMLEDAARLSAARGDTTQWIASLAMLGLDLDQLGAADSGLATEQQAWTLAQNVGPTEWQGRVALGLSRLWQRRGNVDSARKYTRIVSATPLIGTQPGIRLPVAWMALERGDLATAMQYAAEVNNQPNIDLRYKLRARRTLGRAWLARARKDSAAVYLKAALADARLLTLSTHETWIRTELGERNLAPGHTDSIRVAVSYADTAAAVAARARRAAGGDEFQLEAEERATDLFEVWVEGWALLAQSNPDGRLAALAASERGRAQVLLDLMRGNDPQRRTGDDLAREGRRLIASALRGSPALVYQPTDAGLFIWLIGLDGTAQLEHRRVDRDSLATLVRHFRATKSTQEGAALRDVLLPANLTIRIPAGADLVIVPSGVLGQVPFAALPLQQTNELLGLRYALRYSPSLEALREAEQRPAVSPLKHPLIVADPAMPEVVGDDGSRYRLAQLPGAAAEGHEVARQVSDTLITGQAATEAALRQLIPSATLIHLATHGFAYSTQARARDSFIALAPGNGRDGLLTVGEVLDSIRLQAELVVLSACETGLGEIKQSEGTVGLQRAFLAKGARSVLVSLWSVSDEATRSLMERFYAHWLHDPGKPSKAVALQEAQQELASDPRFKAPVYWAAFQLVGAK